MGKALACDLILKKAPQKNFEGLFLSFYASGRAGATSSLGSVAGSVSGLTGASVAAGSCSSVSIEAPRDADLVRDVPGFPVRGFPERCFFVLVTAGELVAAGFLPCCSVAGEAVLARGFLRRLN